jgi:thiol-disulfide isomerase/thioredoxin
LELSLRSVIVLLLLGAAAIGGCDRQSQPAQQANESVSGMPAAQPAAQNVDRSHKGEAAPKVEFLDPDGRKTSLAAFLGKPVLLNLWATWCIPCVREMPTLDRLAGGSGGRFAVLAVSQDMDGKKLVDPFWAKNGYRNLKPYLDPDTGFSIALGANLPTTILYDATGRELWRVNGDMDWTGPAAKALVAEAG